MDPWAGGFYFCAIILELLECWDRRGTRMQWEGGPRQLVKSKVAERGDRKGVQWNEMLDVGGRKEAVKMKIASYD